MFSNDIRDVVFPTDIHGSIARPLAAMGMQDVGLAVLADILVEHGVDNMNPAVDIILYQPGNATLIALADGNAVQPMLVAAKRQCQVVLQAYGSP